MAGTLLPLNGDEKNRVTHINDAAVTIGSGGGIAIRLQSTLDEELIPTSPLTRSDSGGARVFAAHEFVITLIRNGAPKRVTITGKRAQHPRGHRRN
jgi:hypothetical protein